MGFWVECSECKRDVSVTTQRRRCKCGTVRTLMRGPVVVVYHPTDTEHGPKPFVILTDEERRERDKNR